MWRIDWVIGAGVKEREVIWKGVVVIQARDDGVSDLNNRGGGSETWSDLEHVCVLQLTIKCV